MVDPIKGELHVSNNVLVDIIGNAVMECYGVVGMTNPGASDGIIRILPSGRRRQGIEVTVNERGVHVELYVVIEYGINIATVAQNVKDRVEFVLKDSARVPLDCVNVHVEGMKVSR
ncbi:MAG: Asp23/Gls24 family envelope stress response protein [Eggerthellaceae bacterium]|nr:Asp23/Gls24 family envelope stress response protein [Eggerthellaceae bacterium]